MWLNYLRFADETPARKRGRSLVRERLNRKPLLGYDLIRTRHGDATDTLNGSEAET